MLQNNDSSCDYLNINGFNRLKVSGTVRILGIVLGSMSLGPGFEVSRVQTAGFSVCLFLLPLDMDIELSATSSAAVLSIPRTTSSQASCHCDNGLHLFNCNPVPIKCLPV